MNALFLTQLKLVFKSSDLKKLCLFIAELSEATDRPGGRVGKILVIPEETMLKHLLYIHLEDFLYFVCINDACHYILRLFSFNT